MMKKLCYAVALTVIISALASTILAEKAIGEAENIRAKSSFETNEADLSRYIIERNSNTEYALYDVPLTVEQQIYVQNVCESYDLPYEIVLGIMHTESNFNSNAVNGNCYGIMQVHLINTKQYEREFEDLGILNLNSFYEGVEAGCFILSKCKGETMEQKLIAYNEGQAAADEKIKKGISSTSYSRGVLEFAYSL